MGVDGREEVMPFAEGWSDMWFLHTCRHGDVNAKARRQQSARPARGDQCGWKDAGKEQRRRNPGQRGCGGGSGA